MAILNNEFLRKTFLFDHPNKKHFTQGKWEINKTNFGPMQGKLFLRLINFKASLAKLMK